ncbi:MAG: hypothetical protein DDT34_00242 [Firmicutes bacterium]|nr:hypothetical protein [Bacillota bacterium]
MDVQTVLQELSLLSSERTKKVYLRQGAREPLFGVATGAMKPLVKKIKINQPLAEELYATGNFDAMYLAGMIADPKIMTDADFDRWMEGAYFFMISDFIVAVTLAETDFAKTTADRWIALGHELYVSAGYSCYCWLLGNRKNEEFDKNRLQIMLETVEKTIHGSPDRAKYAGYSCYCWLLGNRKNEEFDKNRLQIMLETVEKTIHGSPDRTKYAMNNFVYTVGVSYLPLHERAAAAARSIGAVDVYKGKTKLSVPVAADEIQKAADKGRLGFKRKNVRC